MGMGRGGAEEEESAEGPAKERSRRRRECSEDDPPRNSSVERPEPREHPEVEGAPRRRRNVVMGRRGKGNNLYNLFEGGSPREDVPKEEVDQLSLAGY